jgi:acetyl esterase/lipase
MRLQLALVKSRPATEVRALQNQMGRLIPSQSPKRTLRRVEQLGGVFGTWLSPKAPTSDAVLLYFHGGGYCLGSIDTHGDLVATLAETAQLKTFTPHYRLAPENPYPAALDDAYAAYQALRESGVAPAQIVVGGDSAGGGLSLALLLKLREARQPMPAGALLFSPWVDLTIEMPSVIENAPYDFLDREALQLWASLYRGATPTTHPSISPLYAELSGLPPLLIFAGEVELLIDEAKALYEKARAAHVEARLIIAPDMMHDYPMMHMMAQPAKDAVHHAARFLRDVTKRTA